MTLKAIEAGALAIAELRGAIWTRDKSKPVSATFDYDASKACIEAALASGELVPASAVAAERERCAQVADGIADNHEEDAPTEATEEFTKMKLLYAKHIRRVSRAIRALESANGEFVLVPRETLLNAQRYAWLRDKNACVLEECGSELDELCDDGMNREMLAATSNGSGK